MVLLFSIACTLDLLSFILPRCFLFYPPYYLLPSSRTVEKLNINYALSIINYAVFDIKYSKLILKVEKTKRIINWSIYFFIGISEGSIEQIEINVE